MGNKQSMKMAYLVFDYKKCLEQSSNCQALQECLKANFKWNGSEDCIYDLAKPIHFNKNKINPLTGNYGMVEINHNACYGCENPPCCRACSCFMLKSTISELIEAEYEIENSYYEPLFMTKDRFGAEPVRQSIQLKNFEELKEKYDFFGSPFVVEVLNYSYQGSHFDSVDIVNLIGERLYNSGKYFKFCAKIKRNNGQIVLNEIEEVFGLFGEPFELPAIVCLSPLIHGKRNVVAISGIYKVHETERINHIKSKLSIAIRKWGLEE